MIPETTLRAALEDPALLAMGAPSWAAWRALLLAVMGEPLTGGELDHFRRLTGRIDPPRRRVEELWGVIGRRGGKSRAIAALAVYLGGLCDHRAVLAPGERGLVLVIAPDRDQAAIILGYAGGLLDGSPMLRQLIARKTAEEIELRSGIAIAVRAASFRRLRGFTCVAAIADECAFWYSDESANPDVEILNAVRPTLATTGGPLIAISSPYARRGAMWAAFQRHYGRDGDPAILVAQGGTLDLNLATGADGRPRLQGVVDRAYAQDAAAAAAEYGAQFRSDLESFVSIETLAVCTDRERERRFDEACAYVGFVDPSGGSADSFTLAIAHMEDAIAVLDLVREVVPPFSPAAVVEELAGVLADYGIRTVHGDRYGGEWPREQFALNGITYEPCELTKSELYQSLLPMLNSRTVALLANDRLQRQLLALERRTARGGRDTIDHPRGGRDDVANAAAGALVSAQNVPRAARASNFNRPIEYPSVGVV